MVRIDTDSPASAPAPGAGLRALVVDDSESQRELIRRLLQECGFEQIRLEREGGGIPSIVADVDPHLVTLDLHIAGSGGLEILRALSDEDAHLARRIVLVVTGDTHPTLERQVEALGACGVLPKPFTIDQFLDVITRLVTDFRPKWEAVS